MMDYAAAWVLGVGIVAHVYVIAYLILRVSLARQDRAVAAYREQIRQDLSGELEELHK